jgi:hypothetical protein
MDCLLESSLLQVVSLSEKTATEGGWARRRDRRM